MVSQSNYRKQLKCLWQMQVISIMQLSMKVSSKPVLKTYKNGILCFHLFSYYSIKWCWHDAITIITFYKTEFLSAESIGLIISLREFFHYLKCSKWLCKENLEINQAQSYTVRSCIIFLVCSSEFQFHIFAVYRTDHWSAGSIGRHSHILISSN